MNKTLRVLLVDDDHEDAFLFTRRCGARLQVRHATDIPNGLNALQEAGLDACFVDYHLGSGDGLQFVRMARARHPTLPLVVITGHQIDVLGENALLAGATDFIPKDQLDAPTIERTVRWALIRRHVEVQRDARASIDLIRDLLGRTPLVDPETSGPGSLRRVLYVSTATRPVPTCDLLLMCARFAAANARADITGVLAYSGDRFLQAFEGPAAAISVLLRHIEADPRHGRLRVLLDEPASTRLFHQWHMGLLKPPSSEARACRVGFADDMAARLQAKVGDSLTRAAMERLLLEFSGAF